MKSFEVSDKDIILLKSSSDGYQNKAVCDNNFIKFQAVIGRCAIDDWKTEVLASKVARVLQIPIVHQEPCEIQYRGIVWNGVYSRDYRIDGYQEISFRRILEKFNVDERKFNHFNMADKMNFIVDVLALSGLARKVCKEYVSDMLLLDLLVLNQDRHFKNFGVFLKGGKVCRALLYDCGMGMFENDLRFYDMSDYREAMQYCYSSPYGESIEDTIRYIKRYGLVGRNRLNLIRNIPNYRRVSFPNDMAYDYFKYITKELL